MPRIVKSSRKPAKTNIWKWNPDKSSTKFSHKKYDGSTRKSRKI